MAKSMWDLLRVLSFKFFKRSLEPYVKWFDNLRMDIQMANIRMSLTEYVYVMFFTTFLVFIIEFPVLAIISAFIFKSGILAFLFSFTATIFMASMVFFYFYTYPSFQANRRKKNIDASLPFATTYMATVASSGSPPYVMFKVLAQFPEYGEISKEAASIYRDVEAFGLDIISAIRKTANKTPSSELKELLWGLETVIMTGGDVSSYLYEKGRLFMEEYRRRLQQYSQTLSMLIEMYLTVILVGSIFFIIMTALMSMFGGSGMNLVLSMLQFLVIFVGLPFASIAFIGILKSISPVM